MMTTASPRYLILPGWQGSGRYHWQSHWQRLLPGAQRVEQADWHLPRRADWVNALDRCIAAQPGPVILIAHSLGCITVAHWAAQPTPALRATAQGALPVAPADVGRDGCPGPLQNFAPLPPKLLGFASLVSGFAYDRAASAGRALTLADSWASQAMILEQAGHIKAVAGYRRWEEGFAYL